MRRLGLGEGGQEGGTPTAKSRRKKIALSLCLLCSALYVYWAAATTRAADYLEENTPEARGLLSGMFNEKGRAPKKNDKNKKPAEVVKPQPTETVASAETERQRHENALIRRMQVCDRLRTIAIQSGNEALMNQANELEERATMIYRQQTSGLPMPAQTPLAVLADDQPNPSRDRKARAASAPFLLPNGRGPSRPTAKSPAAGLDGSMDQREQAILNGSSMGGTRP